MNIINKAFLKLALLPAPLYRKAGINISHLKTILNTKLTMDDRRPASVYQNRQRKKDKPVTMATIGTMLISAFMGLIFLWSFSIGADRVTQLTFYFSMFFFILASSLISDFTSVLIDVRDTFIILPKPVTDKTFVIARLLHIFIHICKLVLPMSLPGLIFLGINDGLYASFVLLVMVLFVTLFTIFIINAVYIVILRITTPAKFRTIISYFQIVFAITVYGAYQLIPRLIGQYNMENFSFTPNSRIVFYPFYWFASAWNLLFSFHGSTTSVATALAGLVFPVICLYIVIKYLAPSFNNKLAMINSSGGDPAPVRSDIKTKTGRKSYSEFLAKLFTRTGVEHMGFSFTWKMMDRSRDFKLKVYPGIGYMIVYIVLMVMRRNFNVEDISDETSTGKVFILSGLYLASFILTMAIAQMVFSEKYKASWIYYSTPLAKPGEVILGALKAAVFKFYLPLLLLIIPGSIALIGLRVIPNLVLGLFNEVLIATLVVYAGHKLFPFSMQQSNNAKTGSFLRGIFVFGMAGIIAVGHYLLYDFTVVISILAILSVLATWMMMSGIRNTSWTAIKSAYTED